MKKVLASILTLTMSVLLIGGAGFVMSGCTTANQTAYRVSATARVTIQEGLKFWNDQFVATGKSTIDQERIVKAAYEKAQASGMALADAGAALSAAARQSGTTATTQLMAAFEQAESTFAQDKGDFFNLLTKLGVKLPA